MQNHRARIVLLTLAWCGLAAAEGADAMDNPIRSSAWEATDGLGRQVPTHPDVGPPREGKEVGIFYFLWLGEHAASGPHDVSRIIAENPNAMQEPDNPAWGPLGHYHHWGEPLFGFYRADDPWVLRKHANMLSAAGVDFVVFDVTNQFTYQHEYMTLCKVWRQMRKEGNETPQIAFLTPFWDPPRVVANLHENLYGPGRYEELWYRLDGKPLVLADPAKVDEQYLDFFTFRKPIPSYFTGPEGPNNWGWLEVYPQHVFKNERGEAEQMVAGVAQNAVEGRLGSLSEKGARGRNWHDDGLDMRPGAVNLGLNFAEQFERVLEADPKIVFITGWNEWIAMRFDEFAGVKEPVMFVDQFDQQASRDIEPMRGGHGDHYYYQMVSYIRRFKGARPQQPAGAARTMTMDGDFSKWAGVEPAYRDHVNDTAHRDHPGYAEAPRQVNTTGRNDFVALKAAHDDKKLYFYARTASALRGQGAPGWMTLYINTDRRHDTGWAGYDIAVNRSEPGFVERHVNGAWEPAGEIGYASEGREFELALRRDMAGLEGKLDFEFKWADNVPLDAEPIAFLTTGDAAPLGRFNYRYFEK